MKNTLDTPASCVDYVWNKAHKLAEDWFKMQSENISVKYCMAFVQGESQIVPMYSERYYNSEKATGALRVSWTVDECRRFLVGQLWQFPIEQI